MTPFVPASPADVAGMARAQPLALVVSGGPGEHAVTPLPLLVETDAEGVVTGFFGHFARSNRQVAMIAAEPRALILFQGPQAYVPPAWVSDPTWAPTWNYALARFEVEIRLVPEENERSIVELARALEGDRWTPAEMGPRFHAMLPRIVAFRARVTASEAKFKLGQDERDQTFGEIVEALGDGPLTTMMKAARRP